VKVSALEYGLETATSLLYTINCEWRGVVACTTSDCGSDKLVSGGVLTDCKIGDATSEGDPKADSGTFLKHNRKLDCELGQFLVDNRSLLIDCLSEDSDLGREDI